MAFTLWLMVSLISDVHTAGPAMPSTPMPFWFSNDSMAALTISFSCPWIHSDISSEGWSAQRQANDPSWSTASSDGGGGGPAGVKLRGR